MSYHIIESIKNIVIVLLVCFTALFIVVMYINKKMFQNDIKKQLKRIVEKKYTSRLELEKDIKFVYDLYDKEEKKRGFDKLNE